MKHRKILITLALVGLLSLSLTACGGDTKDGSAQQPPTSPEKETSMVLPSSEEDGSTTQADEDTPAPESDAPDTDAPDTGSSGSASSGTPSGQTGGNSLQPSPGSGTSGNITVVPGNGNASVAPGGNGTVTISPSTGGNASMAGGSIAMG